VRERAFEQRRAGGPFAGEHARQAVEHQVGHSGRVGSGRGGERGGRGVTALSCSAAAFRGSSAS
jgi:hypothetical protein